MARRERLSPGSVATVFRVGAGGDADRYSLGAYDVPADGSDLHLRIGQPGPYVAVDSTGREVAFAVSGREEFAVVPVLRAGGSS
jgi:hypothetical protein